MKQGEVKMASEKTYIVHKYYGRSSRDYYYKGTLPQLVDCFGYTLECGNSWNPKIPTKPKNIRSLMSALEKSVRETQGSCYSQDYYEVVESVPDGAQHFTDLMENN